MRTSAILAIVIQLGSVLGQSDYSQKSAVVVNSDQSDENRRISVKKLITEPTGTKPTTRPIYLTLPVKSRDSEPSDNARFSEPPRNAVYYDSNGRLESLDNSQYPDLSRILVYYDRNSRLEPLDNSQYSDSSRRPIYYNLNDRAIYQERSGRPKVVYPRPTYPEPSGGPVNVDSYGRRIYYYNEDPYYRRNRIDDVPDRYSNRHRERISDRHHHHDESGSDKSESDDSSDE